MKVEKIKTFRPDIAVLKEQLKENIRIKEYLKENNSSLDEVRIYHLKGGKWEVLQKGTADLQVWIMGKKIKIVTSI